MSENLKDSDYLSLALEIMSEDDVQKFEDVSKIAETQQLGIYEALDKYEKEN